MKMGINTHKKCWGSRTYTRESHAKMEARDGSDTATTPGTSGATRRSWTDPALEPPALHLELRFLAPELEENRLLLF